MRVYLLFSKSIYNQIINCSNGNKIKKFRVDQGINLTRVLVFETLIAVNFHRPSKTSE